MALTDNLIAYWKLDESSGTRNDEVGSNDLTQSGTVGNAVGKLTNAADFDGTDDYLECADNADLSVSDIDFTLACWVYFDSVTGVRDIAGKWSSGGFGEYWIDLNSSARLRWNVEEAGSGGTPVSATTFGAISTGTWYYVVGWHDATNNQIGISVNGTAADTASHSAGVTDSSRPFRVGGMHGTSNYLNGRVDALGFWKRKLSESEISQLYNSGSGLEYPFSGGVFDPATSYFPLTPAAYLPRRRPRVLAYNAEGQRGSTGPDETPGET